MKHIHSLDPVRTAQLDTRGVRENYLATGLFAVGQITLAHWETDRAIFGSAIPLDLPLLLETPKELAAETFCERRELGILNIGGAGTVTVDGIVHALGECDVLYVGRSAKSVSFASENPMVPAHFYLLSYPAHATHPTRVIRRSEANEIKLGSKTEANERTLRQYICPGICDSCQIVMGYTEMAEGSVWNTWKPHTHARRSEIYLYFDIQPGECVMHFLGKPDETRHLVVRDREIALSPPWSIHSGCGSKAYRFCWGMGGENQAFTDMDPVNIDFLS